MNHVFLKSKQIIQIIATNFSNDSHEVILKEINKCGLITLNRPKALNSLNNNMIDLIYPTLLKWRNDKNINHVVIEGAGDKAFCAGGDVRKVTDTGKLNLKEACKFFREEYILNYLIGTFEKPYISLIHGITMGGGFGLSVHGKYRVATEKTIFAMPETGIGFYPDVGGSYVLPRLANNIGIYLALVGHRLKGKDVLSAGIATHFVNSHQVSHLKNELVEVTQKEDIEKILNKYNDSKEKHKFSLLPVLNWINEHFSKNSIEEIVNSLSKRIQSTKSLDEKAWCQNQVDLIHKMSPTSLKVTLRQLHEGKHLSFRDCLTMEFRLSSRFMEQNDFYEGVRALIVDKDLKPNWIPNSLKEVTDAIVNQYFQPLADDLILK